MLCAVLSLFFLAQAAPAVPTASAQASAKAAPPQATVAPLAYDTVSVRQNKSGSNSYRFRPSANGILATNITVRSFFMQSYAPISQRLVSGLPDWTETTRFDIEGKLDDETSAPLNNLPPMESYEANLHRMQRILVDRFKLKLHRETKELPAYALVVAKSGPKLKDAEPDSGKNASRQSRFGDGELSVFGFTMDRFVHGLSNSLDREIVDRTGLTGTYDILLKWQAIQPTPDTPASDPESSHASILTALQEQLGLKLEPIKLMTDTIVVDSIEMPSEN
jgi:uncharacterized protein (TIGR03435 family)